MRLTRSFVAGFLFGANGKSLLGPDAENKKRRQPQGCERGQQRCCWPKLHRPPEISMQLLKPTTLRIIEHRGSGRDNPLPSKSQGFWITSLIASTFTVKLNGLKNWAGYRAAGNQMTIPQILIPSGPGRKEVYTLVLLPAFSF